MEDILPSNWNISCRPYDLTDVYGNDSVKKYLGNQIKNDKFDKAYLFLGEPGCGKTTFAKIVALNLSCTNKKSGGQPCCRCAGCKAIIDETWTQDCILVDGNDKESMSAQSAREFVKKFTSFRPTRSKNKVMIIDEAGKLSKEAISAFLKPLESPKENFYYIFTSMENLGKGVSQSALRRRAKTFKIVIPQPNEIYMYMANVAKRLDLVSNKEIPAEFWTKGLEYISYHSNSFGVAINLFEQCMTGQFFTLEEIKQAITGIDEEDLQAALLALGNGDVKNEIITETFLNPKSDYMELFSFASYRLAQGAVVKIYGSLNGDWRDNQARELANTKYFDTVKRIFDKYGNAAFIRKSSFLFMLSEIGEKVLKLAESEKKLSETPVRRRVVK